MFFSNLFLMLETNTYFPEEIDVSDNCTVKKKLKANRKERK
jgi:hypothetical protein